MKVTITRKLEDDEDYGYVPHFSIETENTESEEEFALFANFSARYTDEDQDEIDWNSVDFQGEKVGDVDRFLRENSGKFEDSFKEKTIEFTFAELVVRKVLDEDDWFQDWPVHMFSGYYATELQEFAKEVSIELMKRDVAEISELRDGPITLNLLNKLDKAKDLIRNESLSKK